MENETNKFAYNIRQWITLYHFLLEHFNYEEAKKAGVSKRAKELGRKLRDKKKIIKESKLEKLVGIEWTYEECADLMNLFAGGVVEYTQLYEKACEKISQLEQEMNTLKKRRKLNTSNNEKVALIEEPEQPKL